MSESKTIQVTATPEVLAEMAVRPVKREGGALDGVTLHWPSGTYAGMVGRLPIEDPGASNPLAYETGKAEGEKASEPVVCPRLPDGVMWHVETVDMDTNRVSLAGHPDAVARLFKMVVCNLPFTVEFVGTPSAPAAPASKAEGEKASKDDLGWHAAMGHVAQILGVDDSGDPKAIEERIRAEVSRLKDSADAFAAGADVAGLRARIADLTAEVEGARADMAKELAKALQMTHLVPWDGLLEEARDLAAADVDGLRAKIDDLTHSTKHLADVVRDNERLTNELDVLNKEIAHCARQRQRFTDLHKEAMAESARLKAEVERLTAENDVLKRVACEVERLSAENNDLRLRFCSALSLSAQVEWPAILGRVRDVCGEKDHLADRLSMIRTERDNLAERRNQVECHRCELAQMVGLDGGAAWEDVLKGVAYEIERLTAENNDLRDKSPAGPYASGFLEARRRVWEYLDNREARLSSARKEAERLHRESATADKQVTALSNECAALQEALDAIGEVTES